MRGNDTEFLKANPNSAWHYHMKQLEVTAARMEVQARAAGVPLVVVLLPIRSQAAMISMGTWPAGYDPFRSDSDLRDIIIRSGATYLDILPDFRALPDSEREYFPIDTHLNASGNALISSLLAKEMTKVAPSLPFGWNRITHRHRVTTNDGCGVLSIPGLWAVGCICRKSHTA